MMCSFGNFLFVSLMKIYEDIAACIISDSAWTDSENGGKNYIPLVVHCRYLFSGLDLA